VIVINSLRTSSKILCFMLSNRGVQSKEEFDKHIFSNMALIIISGAYEGEEGCLRPCVWLPRLLESRSERFSIFTSHSLERKKLASEARCCVGRGNFPTDPSISFLLGTFSLPSRSYCALGTIGQSRYGQANEDTLVQGLGRGVSHGSRKDLGRLSFSAQR
jgi:hypothetical protein